MNANQITFQKLPKYLKVEKKSKTWYFHPIIFKWEWDCHDNAYFAMYAKYNPRLNTFDPSKVLFWVAAGTYEEAKDKFLQKYSELECINGKTWLGKGPVKLDLMTPKELNH